MPLLLLQIRHHSGLCLVLAAGFLLATLLLTGCRPPENNAEPPPFRVMTYNIHHGAGLDGKLDLPRIAALIRQEKADIVALQEVDKGVRRTRGRDLPAELAALTGMTCVFSNNFYFQGGEYGNALLTRFPVRQWTNTHYTMLRTNEQRGLLQVTLEAHGREVLVMNTHLDVRQDDAERWSSIEEMEKILERYTAGRTNAAQLANVLFCGDFNDVPASRIYQKTAERFDDVWKLAGQGEGFTIPVTNATRRIDYIWASKNSEMVPLKAWIPYSEASDHLPIVAEMQFKRPAAAATNAP